MQAQVVRHVQTTERLIALSFDDEGSPTRIAAILDVLAREQIPATMFLNGLWITKNKDLVTRMAREGHEIANHSYSHRNFAVIGSSEVQRELVRTKNAIAELGIDPSLLFRPPYGSYNNQALAAAGKAGFPYAVLWSIDTKDWEGRTAGEISSAVITKAKPGDIVLFHLHGRNTAAALPRIITELKQRGYEFVTVGKLIEKGNPIGTWHCAE